MEHVRVIARLRPRAAAEKSLPTCIEASEHCIALTTPEEVTGKEHGPFAQVFAP